MREWAAGRLGIKRKIKRKEKDGLKRGELGSEILVT